MSGEEAPAESSAAAVGEPMDVMTALQMVLKKALAHDGLARGLHQGAKVIEKGTAQLCILAEDCDQPDYVKLVRALCADRSTNLITVPSAKTLGEWAGVSVSFYLSLFFLRCEIDVFGFVGFFLFDVICVCKFWCLGCCSFARLIRKGRLGRWLAVRVLLCR